MGKGRGKWKKQATVAGHENPSSGEEKIMPLKRRGRPLKVLKKETEEKEETTTISDEVVIDNVAEKGGKKRNKSSEIEESQDSVDQENSAKFVGFRQSGSRRKNKPRRAAEVGVECFCY